MKLSLDFLKPIRSYLIVGFVVFCIGVVWNFPFERIQNVILGQIQKQTGINITAQTLSLALPIGFKAERVSIENLPISNDINSLQLDALKLSVSPWSAMTLVFFKTGTLYFDLKKDKGRLSGQLSKTKNTVKVTAKPKDLFLDHVFEFTDPNTQSSYPLGVKASISGDANVELDSSALQTGQFTSLTGNIKIKSLAAKITPPLMQELSFDQVQIESAMDQGKINLKSLALEGSQLNFKSSGSIELKPVLVRSTVKLDGQLSIQKDGESLKSLITMAGINLDASGKVALKLTGTFEKIDFKQY